MAYFVSDVVDQLDLSAIEGYYEQEERGYPPYHPGMMVKVLVYGYCVGVFSSRKLQKHLQEDVGFRVLAAGNQPDFRTLSDFRKLHLEALQGLFEQVLQMALELGAVKLGRVAIDGSKVKGNASKHKAMSYGRMKEDEKRLKQEVQQLLAEAERTDVEEDARLGNQSGDELPAELQRREERLQRIRQAKRALEKRIQEEAAAKGDDPASSKPEAKAQYNFTDPESRILKGADGFVQGYNAQIAVESETQLIVGQTITQAANDKQQLLPMIDHVEQQAGQRPEEVVADNGYASEENLEGAEAAQIEVYVAVGRDKHNQRQSRCPRGPLPKTATRMDRMRRKLKTKVGRAIYATRKTIVEPVFGQIKQAQGFRQFLLRGLKKVQGEWALVCMAHNVLKVHRMVYT